MMGFHLIGPGKISVVTKRRGLRLPQGIIARNGEIGVQSETLRPGFYWKFPLLWQVEPISSATYSVPSDAITVDWTQATITNLGRKINCDYCSGVFDIQRDTCPHCGAPSSLLKHQ